MKDRAYKAAQKFWDHMDKDGDPKPLAEIIRREINHAIVMAPDDAAVVFSPNGRRRTILPRLDQDKDCPDYVQECAAWAIAIGNTKIRKSVHDNYDEVMRNE